MKRSNENSVIVGISSFYDPPMEPLIFVPACKYARYTLGIPEKHAQPIFGSNSWLIS